MNALAEKLRRLRADAGVATRENAPAIIAPVSAARIASARTDLSALSVLRELARARQARHPESPIPNPGSLRPVPLAAPAGDEIAPGVRYVEQSFPYPADPVLALPVESHEPVARERLLCFDTETTGLAGGVGTRAFMIGVAAWADGRLRVRQLYLTAMAGEAAMLRIFAGWLRTDSILVSYNGKSYDAPLLKGRFRLNRVQHRLDDLPHLDWLHPVRRRYRGVFANCRLATIEREALRIVREDDLPGSEAPAAWLAFLRGQSSRNLGRVLDHNRQDVVTLMRLGDHMAGLLPDQRV
ncbi:MAG: ribonuclease H-like domain-containing protein [Xanthomonadales bacterium]|nr:ribonuclease H-like domain-containing protein [Xanthomonadales bacterium]